MVNLAGLKEYETLSVMRTHSLARFGDGELKLMYGEDSLSQVWNQDIQDELWDIVINHSALLAMPYVHPESPRKDYWKEFLETHSVEGDYYSSFITRFDEAPWLDTPEYRSDIFKLWRDKAVVIVRGQGSLTSLHLRGAKSVREVIIPSRDAYSMIDKVEWKIEKPELVILCAGAVGTILADWLAAKGVHAIDLGFIGKFL